MILWLGPGFVLAAALCAIVDLVRAVARRPVELDVEYRRALAALDAIARR